MQDFFQYKSCQKNNSIIIDGKKKKVGHTDDKLLTHRRKSHYHCD